MIAEGGARCYQTSDEKEQEAVRIVRVRDQTQNDVVPKKRARMAQLDDVKEVQGNDSEMREMEEVDAKLREHIEAQLLSASPRFESGETVLHRAAKEGLGGVVARLLAACPVLIDLPDQSRGWTAFHFAADAGRTAIVAQLLAANPALIDARARDDWTALHCAANGGKTAVVTQLLAADPVLIDARTDDGRTAFHLAALHGQTAIVTQLLATNPASLDARTNDGRTALHLAAGAGHQEIVTQLLAANPALIEAKTNDGDVALDFALEGEEIKIAVQLLAAKPTLIEAIINGDDSWTALLYAVMVDHEEAASRLLAMHPDLCYNLTRCDWTVFHEAAYFGSNKVMSRLLAAVPQPDLEQLLLQRSTDLFDMDTNKDPNKESYEISHEGSTALHVAARKGHSSIVAQLLAACPSLADVLDGEGQTCLHCAFIKLNESPDSTTTAEMLLAFKPALIHAVDACGDTMLHFLIRSRHKNKELIEKVWKKMMNPDALHAVDREGCTPFQLAVFMHNDIAIDLLQWSVTIDEIVIASNYAQRFKPLVELQCEELALKLLPDLVAIVFEYAGFSMRDYAGGLTSNAEE